MGAECCGNKGQIDLPTPRSSRTTNLDDEIQIYGDHFNQDTRALLAICEIAGVKYKFINIDTFKGDNMKEPFTNFSPSGCIPVIREDGRLIIGKGDLSLLYSPLIVNHPEISEVLYPANQVEDISRELLWIKKSLRKQTGILVQKTIQASQNARDSCRSSGNLKQDVALYF